MFSAGLPSTVTELETEIKNQCTIKEPFQLQFMDMLFGNEFMNLTSMEEVQDKATVKVIHISCKPLDALADQCVDGCLFPPTSHPDDPTFSSDDSTVILASPESTFSRSLWPDIFHVPHFSYLDISNRGSDSHTTDSRLNSDLHPRHSIRDSQTRDSRPD